MRRSRQRAEGLGRWAENLALWRYRLTGFRVLARRYKTPVGEIDLVMRRGGLVVFIEVKARQRLDDALSALDKRQQQRLSRAAAAFLSDYPRHRDCAMRFDLVGIQPGRLPVCVTDAWRLE